MVYAGVIRIEGLCSGCTGSLIEHQHGKRPAYSSMVSMLNNQNQKSILEYCRVLQNHFFQSCQLDMRFSKFREFPFLIFMEGVIQKLHVMKCHKEKGHGHVRDHHPDRNFGNNGDLAHLFEI